jgi:cytochrome c oxidase assembly protein subunit 15
VIGAVGLALVGAAGAITALGDTLFPAESLLEGIRSDFTGTFLVRLRWIHPILAVAVTAYLLWWVQRTEPASDVGRRGASALTGLLTAQLALGALNVALLAPVWMQVIHLLVADAVWLAFVLFGAEVLVADRVTEPAAT